MWDDFFSDERECVVFFHRVEEGRQPFGELRSRGGVFRGDAFGERGAGCRRFSGGSVRRAAFEESGVVLD